MVLFRLAALPAIVWVLSAQSSEPPEALLQRALSAHQAGKIEEAIRDYRQYLKIRPDAIEARSNLGAALAKAGRYEEAIAEYKLALHKSPSNPGVSFNLALAYYKSGAIRDAERELSILHALVPEQQQVTLLLADCHLQLGEYRKVIELLAGIEQKDADNLAVAYMLGTALVKDNQVERGQRLLDRILRDGDRAEARMLMGLAKIGQSDFAGALEDFRRAVELNPKLPTANAYHGQALMATGDAGGAAGAFRAELALNPNEFLSNLNLAVILKQDQEYDEAMKYLDRALRVRPGDLGVRYQIATIRLAQGNVDPARIELERILKEAPEFTEAHVSLATAYYRLKRKQDGDREREIVLRLNAEAQKKQPRGEAAKPEAKP